MKWDRIVRESKNRGLIWNVRVNEITPDRETSGYESDAGYMVQCYIDDQARKYYRNGVIPEDELEEMEGSLRCILVQFKFNNEEEDYDNCPGEAMFVIDENTGDLCGFDDFSTDLPTEIYDLVESKAYDYVGVEKGGSYIPEY